MMSHGFCTYTIVINPHGNVERTHPSISSLSHKMPVDTDQGLHVVIFGAGIGGLASALALAKHGIHRIDVYEVASNLGFVGAGIQLAPNMVRILQRLGCWEPIAKEATELKIASIRREYY